jgi:hypothetical protein
MCCTVAGVNLLFLSRVMSLRLSHGTYNSGMLSTEVETLAHVVVGYVGAEPSAECHSPTVIGDMSSLYRRDILHLQLTLMMTDELLYSYTRFH